MRTNPGKKDGDCLAFTSKELCVVLGTLFILAVVFLYSISGVSSKAVRINCVNNLKQVGLAFRIWSGDHADKYPMAAFTNQSGGRLWATGDSMYRYFQVMSNEIGTPKVVSCPADERYPATNFNAGFSNTNISYFINLLADESNPNNFICGDRSLAGGNQMGKGAMLISSNQTLYWWPKKMHRGNGNIALTDGSVAQLNNARLNDAFIGTRVRVVGLLFP